MNTYTLRLIANALEALDQTAACFEGTLTFDDLNESINVTFNTDDDDHVMVLPGAPS